MLKRSCLFASVLFAFLAMTATSQTATDVSELFSSIQERDRANLQVVRRPVMSNPYDEVQSIQEAQKSAAWGNATAIEALFLQAKRHLDNPDAVIKGQITRLLRTPAEIDQRAALELLNLDAGEIKVDRVPARTARLTEPGDRRDWMVPSISMLQAGDTSIGQPLPQASFIEGWELLRDHQGENVVGRVGDPLSRVQVRVGMVLGEYGRIMAVRDTRDAYYLVLENGDRIAGSPGI